MVTDVVNAVRGCGHCNAANIVSREASQRLKSIKALAPLDVWCFDAWKPGDIPNKGRGKLPPDVAVLTGMDVMTGFAAQGEMYAIDSEEAARVMLTRFGGVFGLPKLVLIDDGSKCKDLLIKTCEVLMIKYHVISKGSHKAMIVE